ncbi:MAG: 3-hydroxyacyl-CoA dehydrogenase family protein [Deltaproteobacteria bacterium]|nr:3-hydroxyacyl-CoA dehydrogenase family protein [Deltaproteobacteria bacterium]MBM4298000.1 3-hydroxyacyl-CoA dehydrogenase family protein [Deltaproteobacteria bacterium]
MSDRIKSLGVVGLGVMGFDIAFLYASRGYETRAFDASKAAMDTIDARREQTVERLQKRQRLSAAEADNVRKLLLPATELAALAHTDLITEAVSEKASTKLAVYKSLRDAGFNGLLTTNTSSVTRATLTKNGVVNPANFALTHFFNPVLYTQMVEVVTGDMGADNRAAILSFLKSLDRDPVATQDISGFVSNGILMVYAVMACRLLECGAKIEQVDQAAKELKLLPPFVSFDSWKPSIVEDVTRIMRELRGDEFLRSSKLLARLAESNPRFYSGPNPNPKIYELTGAGNRSVTDAEVKLALQTSMLVAAARVAELGEAQPVVDRVGTEGIKMPQPPLRDIDSMGIVTLLDNLAEANRLLGVAPLPAPVSLVEMARTRVKFYSQS